MQRLCRDEGLRVRTQKRKRSRVGASTLPGDRQVAAFPNHVGALDFQFDQTRDARVLKLLNITDEFTKTTLAIEVERSIGSDHLVRVLERLVTIHGTPMFIRMDNARRDDRERFARLVPVHRNRSSLYRTRISMAEHLRGIIQWQNPR